MSFNLPRLFYADNTTLNTGSGGDSIRDKDRAGVKTQIVALDLNPAGAETLMVGTMPISDSLGQSTNSAATGFLKVTDEPRQLFYDSFDAAIDTTNMWTSTQGSSGVAASVATGILSMGTGTVANGYSKLISIPTFKPTIPGWVVFSDAIALPDGAAPVANSYRFWGSGTTPATPTVAAPITDGYGFELYTDGKLRAVVYAGGTRTIIADLSSSGTGTQPLNASYHRWIIQVRTDKTYFFIDSIASSGLVATTNFQSSQAQILPKLFLCIGNSTPPVSNTQIQCSGSVVSDTGKNTTQISDGTYPFRKAQVTSLGALKVNTDGIYLFRGRASTFRTPGRAGTGGQKLMSLHNATGSTVVVSIEKIYIDIYQTVIKAVTVAPPVIRAWKVTVLPTNGTSLVKTKTGGTSTSNASVTVLGDAASDGSGSGTTLTATLPTGTFVSQEFAPRLITAAGYEVADRIEFFGDSSVELQALEGIVVYLDYTLATQNPSTDVWIVGMEWTET